VTVQDGNPTTKSRFSKFSSDVDAQAQRTRGPEAARLKKLQGFCDDLEALAYCFYAPLTGIRKFIRTCRALAIDEMPGDYAQFVLELLE
jgi:hypothetical protein